MNQIFNYLNQINYINFFKQEMTRFLSLEKKVNRVATILLGGIFSFTLIYFLYRRFRFKSHSHLNKEENRQAQETEKTQKQAQITLEGKNTVASVNQREKELFSSMKMTLNSHEVSTTEMDQKAFSDYLLSHPEAIMQNKILLQHTVCKNNNYPSTIRYHQVMPPQNFEKEMQQMSLNKLPACKVTYTSELFDYLCAHHFYPDFAHATCFGGAYRSFGCVQEERLFAEFPELAFLDFKMQGGIHPCVDSYSDDKHITFPPYAKPSPFIIEGISRKFDISKIPYGGDFQKSEAQTIITGIRSVENAPSINIMGLAAVDWRGVKNPKYQRIDLSYHLQTAYIANCSAKMLSDQRGWKDTVIHTAPWGCGAFLNSEKMITALQYLAARMAAVELVFHGVGNGMNLNYTKTDIETIIKWIDELIEQNKSLDDILQILVEKSHQDSTWAPKSKE